jgi:L-amino acid N-acyltransferase YncA
MEIEIAPMTEADWPGVAAIYQEGIDTGNATFAQNPPASWAEWQKSKINACSLVARSESGLRGWAALSPTSSRCVYAGVAEVSIYVGQTARSKGVGRLLMQALIHASEENGIWTLQAGIFPENQGSLRLHEIFDFRVVGRRKKLGKMEFGPLQGQWRDVLFLERRSTVVGIE